VTFDSDIEIVSADDEEELDPLLVQEQVRRAIERHKAGDHNEYERIRSIFTTPPDKPQAPLAKSLRIHLQAVLANVALLSKDCNTLVGAVVQSEWIGRDDAYYALFVRFLSNLAAAQRGFQSKIMGMLVEMLGPQKTRRVQGGKPVRQPRIHKRTMQAIQHITLNVPAVPGALAEKLSARLQFEFEKPEDRMTYIRSFMDLINYVPELTSEILNDVLRELIKLDVYVQDSLDDEDDLEEDLLQHMSMSQTLLFQSAQTKPEHTSDEDDLSSEDTDSDDDEAEPTPDEVRRKQLKENVRQVDMIMDILFNYYDSLVESSSLDARHTAIKQLINQFHSHILPTYGSRHPQFLIFHFAQSDEITVDEFVTSCVDVLVSKRHSPNIRHAAAAYFAGFVGRGAKVSSTVVHDCVDLLCDKLGLLQKQYEPQCRGPDVKKFGDFYAVFQAILYIFCFRWRDIASPSSDLDDADDYDDDEHEEYHFSELVRDTLYKAIFSPLNPLRICTPVIVEQFARLSQALSLFSLWSKIEENKHIRVTGHWRGMSDLNINQPDRDQSWIGDTGMLEGYFPYDPYHLPISKHWIEEDYVEWKGIPGEIVEDSEDEDMEETDDEI
jgi:RNA polymerase I-specific transcription initiation factor RRN3